MGDGKSRGKGKLAEEHVRTEQFDEFVKRIEDRFDYVNQRFDSINQRLADAEKAREQNLVHLNQRFDDLKESMADIRADMRQMRNWVVWLFGLAAFGFVGSIVLILFRDVFK